MTKHLDEQAMQSELSGSAFFQPPSPAASQRVTPPADKPVSQPAAEPANQPARRPASPVTIQPSSQSGSWVAPARAIRLVEEHAYDIFQDQARWLSRVQLELEEVHETKINKYEIVQVALDWLRLDYESNGEASQLIKKLTKLKP